MIDKKSMFDSVLEVVAHEFRYELQYIFIPKLVAAINNGELDSSHLHKVEYLGRVHQRKGVRCGDVGCR